jgi:choice-of-anchor A domain-containing protein
VDFGVAAEFNAMVFTTFTSDSNDVQGKLGAGGDISLNHYSIADQLTTTQYCVEVTLIAGGQISWPEGQNYLGNIVAGKSSPSISGQVLDAGCCVQIIPNFFNFTLAFQQLTALSAKYAAMSSTVQSTSIQWGAVTFALSGNPNYEVIYIDNPNYFINNVSFISPLINYAPGKAKFA